MVTLITFHTTRRTCTQLFDEPLVDHCLLLLTALTLPIAPQPYNATNVAELSSVGCQRSIVWRLNFNVHNELRLGLYDRGRE
jgi:hypothetical protein